MLPLWPDVLRSWSPALRGGPSGFIKRMMAAKVVPGRDGRSERKKTFYLLLWTNITLWFLLKRTWTWTTFLRTTLFGLGSFHTVVCTRIHWQYEMTPIGCHSHSFSCLSLQKPLNTCLKTTDVSPVFSRFCRSLDKEEGVWHCDGSKETSGGEGHSYCRDEETLDLSLHPCRHPEGDVIPALSWTIKYVLYFKLYLAHITFTCMFLKVSGFVCV